MYIWKGLQKHVFEEPAIYKIVLLQEINDHRLFSAGKHTGCHAVYKEMASGAGPERCHAEEYWKT